MLESETSIQCDIVAPSETLRRELAQIAQICAVDLKLALPLKIHEAAGDPTSFETTIHLSVHVESAIADDAIWNLACRIACFCPQARITTHIENARQYA